MCLNESCFSDSWKVLLVVPVFKNVGKGLLLKSTTLFLNNEIVDHIEKCGFFSDFLYSFRSSCSTTDLLTVFLIELLGLLLGLRLLEL